MREPGGQSLTRAAAVFIVAALFTLGCRIAPVVTSTEAPSGRYGECRRAARSYCQKVLGAVAEELDLCLAEHTYKCVAGLRQ